MVSPDVVNPSAPKFVDLNGRQIKGRPIRYDRKVVTRDFRDDKGELVAPVLFESMCPFCCLRIEFAGGLKSVQCMRCKRGADVCETDDFPDPFCDPGQFDSDQTSQVRAGSAT